MFSESISLVRVFTAVLREMLLRNILTTVNLGCALDLKRIALQTCNAEYNPKRSASVIMRTRNPRTTATSCVDQYTRNHRSDLGSSLLLSHAISRYWRGVIILPDAHSWYRRGSLSAERKFLKFNLDESIREGRQKAFSGPFGSDLPAYDGRAETFICESRYFRRYLFCDSASDLGASLESRAIIREWIRSS